MDAYSYIQRGEVFANAQTGNILLFGIHLSEGDFKAAGQYFLPVLAFTAGIALSDVIHIRDAKWSLHWRQISVFAEAVILLAVAFIPLHMNFAANALTSFACGIQVESFRKIHGKGISTTMCIGNLRSATQNLCDYLESKEQKYLRNSMLYFGTIFCFAIGAVLGNFAIGFFGRYAIIACAILEFLAFALMFVDREKEETQFTSAQMKKAKKGAEQVCADGAVMQKAAEQGRADRETVDSQVQKGFFDD